MDAITKAEAKEKITKLIEKYERVKTTRQIFRYSEADTRREFVMPLFQALGWDVYNDFTRDVIEEVDAVRGTVDYQFLINNIPKFLLEAKALKVDLDRQEWTKQAVTYSWNKNISWAVLTDFEGLKLFNSEWKIDTPRPNLEFSYRDYLTRFDKLWLLSKESIEKGELDRIASEWGILAKRVNVDRRLAEDLLTWREFLFDNLRQWNPERKQEEIEESVQRILDRLIFIRVCEDRQLEPSILWPALQKWLQRGRKPYNFMEALVPIFRQFDEKYNSNLFQPHLCERLETEGDPFNIIISELYANKEQGVKYRFDAIGADVLGSIYEQYLGRVQTKREGDKSKRKRQGIYYTPSYIVNYIVENTLRKVLKEKSLREIENIKILDPACGSGSFLIKAFEVIDRYLEEQKNQKGATPIIAALRKYNILQKNIYGVDLDHQAIEIARLNLLINALEPEVKLPILSNLKVGNSLISGSDKELKDYIGKSYKDKKPFNWKEEFPEVFKQGGFDVIIGNPPYIFARGGSFDEVEKKYYYDHYPIQQYQINTFSLFIELAHNLLKPQGYFGFIIPNNWLTINSFSKLREFLLKNTGQLHVINAIDTVFDQASVDTCILLFQKVKPDMVRLGELKDGKIGSLREHKPEEFLKNDFILKIAPSSGSKDEKFDKIFARCVPLGEITRVSTGLKAYQVGKGKPPQTQEIKESRSYHSRTKVNKTYLSYLNGVDVKRYELGWSGEYLSYGDWLAEPRRSVPFDGPRILVRQIPSPYPACVNGVFIKKPFLNDINSMVIFDPKSGYDLKYLLAVINSRLLSFWFMQTFDKFQRKIFPQFKVNELARFPIYPADKKQQKVIIELAERMLNLHRQLQNIPENSNKWSVLRSEIEKVDRKIDDEVYKFYGLTPEEIAIIEGN